MKISYPKLSGGYLLAAFRLIPPGDETSPNGADTYEVFGDFDIAHLYYREPKAIPFDIEGVSDSLDFSGEKIIIAFGMEDGVEPRWNGQDGFDNWLHQYPLVALYTLQTDPYIGEVLDVQEKTAMGEPFFRVLLSHIEEYFKGTESRIPREDVAFFAGVGRNHFYLLCIADDFEKIISVGSYLRYLTLGQWLTACRTSCEKQPTFAHTNTTIMVSHRLLGNAKDSLKVPVISGKCMVEIRVHCSPGYEQIVMNGFPEDQFEIFDCFGSVDLVVRTRKPMGGGTLFDYIIKFRTSHASHGNTVTTSTAFIEEPSSSIKAIKLSNSFSSSELIVEFDRKITEVKKNLQGKCPNLYHLLDHLHGHLGSLINSQHQRHLIYDLIPFVDILNGRVQNLFHPSGPPSTIHLSNYDIENQVRGMLYFWQKEINQRIKQDHNFLSIRGHPFIGYSDGITAFYDAVWVLIKTIDQFWLQSHSKIAAWRGFVHFCEFRENCHFEYQSGEIFVFPFHPLKPSPLLAPTSWITIGHEYGHKIIVSSGSAILADVAERINKFMLEKDDNYSSLWHDYVLSNISFQHDLSELYANWFEFTYIYNENLDNYIKHVWLARIQLYSSLEPERFRRYVSYSTGIVLAAMHDSLKITDNIQVTVGLTYVLRKVSLLLTKVYEDPCNDHLGDNLLDAISNSLLMIMNADHRKMYFIHSKQNYFIIKYLSKKRHDEAGKIFQGVLHNTHQDMSQYIDKIKSGEVITGQIDNPFLLVYKLITEEDWSLDSPNLLRTSLALVKSLQMQKYYL